MFAATVQDARHSPLLELAPRLLAREIFVLLGVLGFGFAALRRFKPSQRSAGLVLCTGVAVWLSIGGWLNLLGVASKPVLLALLSTGFVLAVLQIANRDARANLMNQLRGAIPSSPGARAAALTVLTCFLLIILLHLSSFTWNRYDDVQAYIPFAAKASALGGLQADPFSERRITSGVGGATFLNATMLAGGGISGIDFFEGVVGLLAILLCLYAVLRRLGLGTWSKLAVFAAALFFTVGRVNISSVNLSAAMFLGILLLLCEASAEIGLSGGTAAQIGLLAAAAFTLKSSNVPFCALLVFITACAYAWRSRSFGQLRALGVAAITGFVLLIPWCLKHKLDEGTALFPSLGRGFHISAYGFPSIAHTAPFQVSLFAGLTGFLFPALAALLGIPLLRRNQQLPSAPILAFFTAAALAAPLFAVSIAGEDINRFLLPVEDLSALLFLAIVLVSFERSKPSRGSWIAAGFFLLWAVDFNAIAHREFFYRDENDLTLLIHPKAQSPHLAPFEVLLQPQDITLETERIRHAQMAVPPGAVLLENVSMAFGFDWHRNRVLIADYPGMASPPPGLPLDGSPEDVRHYLLAQGVQFVLLDRTLEDHRFDDYASFRQDPVFHISRRNMFLLQNPPRIRGYSVMEATIGERWRNMLEALARTQPVVFDDGRLVVIALDRPH